MRLLGPGGRWMVAQCPLDQRLGVRRQCRRLRHHAERLELVTRSSADRRGQRRSGLRVVGLCGEPLLTRAPRLRDRDVDAQPRRSAGLGGVLHRGGERGRKRFDLAPRREPVLQHERALERAPHLDASTQQLRALPELGVMRLSLRELAARGALATELQGLRQPELELERCRARAELRPSPCRELRVVHRQRCASGMGARRIDVE